MKLKKIKVPFYKWKIYSIVVESFEDRKEVLKKLKALKLTEDHLSDVEALFDNEAINGANCYHNRGGLFSVIITMPHPNAVELVSTLLHEGDHIKDIIEEVTRIEGTEAKAYLGEYIQIELIKEYIKDETYSTKG